jgi:hypothetical protein
MQSLYSDITPFVYFLQYKNENKKIIHSKREDDYFTDIRLSEGPYLKGIRCGEMLVSPPLITREIKELD